jgi:hypothetical protein
MMVTALSDICSYAHYSARSRSYPRAIDAGVYRERAIAYEPDALTVAGYERLDYERAAIPCIEYTSIELLY